MRGRAGTDAADVDVGVARAGAFDNVEPGFVRSARVEWNVVHEGSEIWIAVYSCHWLLSALSSRYPASQMNETGKLEGGDVESGLQSDVGGRALDEAPCGAHGSPLAFVVDF